MIQGPGAGAPPAGCVAVVVMLRVMQMLMRAQDGRLWRPERRDADAAATHVHRLWRVLRRRPILTCGCVSLYVTRRCYLDGSAVMNHLLTTVYEAEAAINMAVQRERGIIADTEKEGGRV
jgi:hypothetical protein